MIYHLLWSGSSAGGAQKVAIELSKMRSDICTSSFKSGTLRDLFAEKGLMFTQKWYFSIFKATIIIASDYRAICTVLLLRLLFFQRFRIIGVIHSNRRSNLDYLAKYIFKLLSREDHILVTTNEQMTYLTNLTTKAPINVCRIHEFHPAENKVVQNFKNVMFFGRVSKQKRVGDYVDAVKVMCQFERQFYVFGPIENSCEIDTKDSRVIVKEGWHDLASVVENFEIGYVVIPNPDEGISLITIECVELGALPLTRANSAFETLGLPDELRWIEGTPLDHLITKVEGSRTTLMHECRKAINSYQNTHLHLNTMIGKLTDETSAL